MHRKYGHKQGSSVAEHSSAGAAPMQSSFEILHGTDGAVAFAFVLSWFFWSPSVQTHTSGSRGPFSRVPHSICTLLTSA